MVRPIDTGGWTEPARREAFRQERLARIPGWYRPWAHLAFPSFVGLAAILVCVWLLRDLSPWELLTIPAVLVFSNALEWRAHRDVLHRRNRLLPMLYDQHTPMHHRLYNTSDMALRDWSELRFILIPAYGILGILGLMLPIAAVLALAGLRNPGALFVATSMAYVLSYEWLHLSYHLPKDHPIGRLRLIRVLSRHHATHHDPRLMQRWNMNVTVPLWDWVRGTIYRGGSSPA